jgi:FkbM family methyltransferase
MAAGVMVSPFLSALRVLGHQHWIPRGRNFVLRLLCDPDRQPSRPFEVDFFGRRYPGDLSNFIDWTVFFFGASSHDELFLMRDLAQALRRQGRPVVVYDIGANIGHHTLFASGCADRVVAFEPFEAVRRKLEQKLAVNAIANVSVYPVALGAADGSFPFYPPSGANEGTGSLLPVDGVEPIAVPVRKGDELVREEGLPPPTIVKIDVEGAETEAFEGLRETLSAARPFVLMELLGATRERVGDEAGLRALLYPDADIYTLEPARGKWDYVLRPFAFDSAFELLVAPRGAAAGIPELAARMKG